MSIYVRVLNLQRNFSRGENGIQGYLLYNAPPGWRLQLGAANIFQSQNHIRRFLSTENSQINRYAFLLAFWTM